MLVLAFEIVLHFLSHLVSFGNLKHFVSADILDGGLRVNPTLRGDYTTAKASQGSHTIVLSELLGFLLLINTLKS
ncbi:hypothetical protein KC19_6G216000 [Ceratodon purpureus]|uniref:Uncharacterized protein n=1 Tax=Ceratodon purpureus TaxID=3225 RepID=A0A8T0HK43_CERPU|nr:hypothetical protein KC19_6G216000 [Ceratodon purpureus]